MGDHIEYLGRDIGAN